MPNFIATLLLQDARDDETGSFVQLTTLPAAHSPSLPLVPLLTTKTELGVNGVP